ncbi:ketopantoate reductase family protein [Lichenicoccus sp.]|uniref:ketopantoate reductase family protein n=1 Tax=Lichenicoccus sp. TaxID=2781899 RepID=UPI003D12103E
MSELLIWGAGAVDGTIGASLVRAGQDVLLVDADAEHVAAMRGRGLAIEGPIERFTVPVRVALPEEVSGRFDRILLCVKAHHTEAATRALLPHLAESGYVASLQNGLNEPLIGGIVGMHRVIGAFINFGADMIAPGRILYGGRGACVLGELDGRPSARLDGLHARLLCFEPAATVTDDIFGYLWGKLGYGALLFATAVTNESIADVLEAPEYRAILVALAREVIAVSLARGVRPRGFNGFDPAAFAPGGDDAAIAASFNTMVSHNRRSAKSHSGIWRDLAIRKRRTEVDAQLDPVVETGVPVAAPLTRRLITMIHQIEDGARLLDRANLLALAHSLPESI